MIPPLIQPGNVFQRLRMPNDAGVAGKAVRAVSVNGSLIQLEWFSAASTTLDNQFSGANTFTQGATFKGLLGGGLVLRTGGLDPTTGSVDFVDNFSTLKARIGADAGNNLTFNLVPSGVFAFNKGATFAGNITATGATITNGMSVTGTANFISANGPILDIVDYGPLFGKIVSVSGSLIIANNSGPPPVYSPLVIGNGVQTVFEVKHADGAIVSSGPLTSTFQSLSVNPTTSDLTASQCRIIKNTALNQIQLWTNDGGVMRTVGATGTIGGSTGATANRILTSSGTGGSTLQATGIGVDGSNNVTGVTSILSGDSNVAFNRLGFGFYSNPKIQVSFTGGGCYEFATGWAGGSFDGQLARGGAGLIHSRSNSGFRVRNLADNADAPITCSSLTASGLVSGTVNSDSGNFAAHFRQDGIGAVLRLQRNNGGASGSYIQCDNGTNAFTVSRDGLVFANAGYNCTTYNQAVYFCGGEQSTGWGSNTFNSKNIIGYCNNAERIRITTAGAEVTGNLTASGGIGVRNGSATAGQQSVFWTDDTGVGFYRATMSLGVGGVGVAFTRPVEATGLVCTGNITASGLTSLQGLQVQGQLVNFNNAAASTPSVLVSGAWFTGGTSTTTKPHLLVEPFGTTSTTWSTFGTGIGVNAASGFIGNLIDLKSNNATLFSVNGGGQAFGLTRLIFFSNDLVLYSGGSFPAVALGNNTNIYWESGSTVAGSRNVGLVRSASGQIGVNDGSNGSTNWRDLILRDLTATGAVTSVFQSLSADPTTLDLAAGQCRIIKNTTSGSLRLWANDGGTIKSVTLT